MAPLRRRLSPALLVFAWAAAACSHSFDDAAPSSGAVSLTADTKTVVQSPTRTHEGPAPGLCNAWSGRLVDVSALATTLTSPGGYPIGLSLQVAGDVFGVGTVGTLDQPGAMGMRIDRTGAATAALFPVEDAAGAIGMIPTPDGWVLAWETPSIYAADSGSVYLVSYDRSGAPLARTGTQPAGGCGMLGAGPLGGVDLAWCTTSDWSTDSASWVVSSVASVTRTSFSSFHGVGAPSREAPLGWQGGAFYSVTSTTEGTGRAFHTTAAHLRGWDPSGHSTLDTPVPNGGYEAITPGRDGALAIMVGGNQITFASATEEHVFPSDISLDTPSIVATPGGVTVASGEAVAGSGGTGNAIQLVEFSPTGARSPAAMVLLSDGATEQQLFDSGIWAMATDDGNAVLVVSAARGIVAALFTCAGRS